MNLLRSLISHLLSNLYKMHYNKSTSQQLSISWWRGRANWNCSAGWSAIAKRSRSSPLSTLSFALIGTMRCLWALASTWWIFTIATCFSFTSSTSIKWSFNTPNWPSHAGMESWVHVNRAIGRTPHSIRSSAAITHPQPSTARMFFTSSTPRSSTPAAIN